MALRWRTCPFALVEAEVPRAGRVLDVGCGHGLLSLLLAETSPDRDVVGIDIDEDKLALARQAAAAPPTLTNVSFGAATTLDDLDGTFDAICLVDVLYLVGGDDEPRLLAALAARLAPGGRLVVKEMAERPRWKYRWMHAEEVVATRVVRITDSTDGTLSFTSPATLAGWMADSGLDVRTTAIDRGYPYPHVLLVGEKPQSATAAARGTGEMAATSSDVSQRGSSTGTGG